MPGPDPAGEPAPADGSLPDHVRARVGGRTELGWYLHVPYCRSRCGYCDFNTYTAEELGGGASRSGWADHAIAEIRLARRVLDGIDAPAPTIFFGGGTPTLLPPQDLGRVVHAIASEFAVAPDAEITVEANPDDVTPDLLEGLLEAGANRISLGMQSADRATLRTLERTHRAEELPRVVEEIRTAGFERMSLDLIYGTPGETAEQWAATVRAALDLRPDHVSAYCLGIEEGTRLAARVRAGRLPPVDPDEAADRYEAADGMLSDAGLDWYEISNWSLPGQQSRHNLGYWRNADWWGAGPGAHSHIGGVRWWNRRHPRAWSAAVEQGRSPASAREVLGEDQRAMERVLLGVRLAEGVPVRWLHGGAATAAQWIADGLAEPVASGDRVRLTRTGRLLADRLALQAVPQDGPGPDAAAPR